MPHPLHQSKNTLTLLSPFLLAIVYPCELSAVLVVLFPLVYYESITRQLISGILAATIHPGSAGGDIEIAAG